MVDLFVLFVTSFFLRGGDDVSVGKPDGRKKKKEDPSREYIDLICSLYGDSYDDRDEDRF